MILRIITIVEITVILIAIFRITISSALLLLLVFVTILVHM